VCVCVSLLRASGGQRGRSPRGWYPLTPAPLLNYWMRTLDMGAYTPCQAEGREGEGGRRGHTPGVTPNTTHTLPGSPYLGGRGDTPLESHPTPYTPCQAPPIWGGGGTHPWSHTQHHTHPARLPLSEGREGGGTHPWSHTQHHTPGTRFYAINTLNSPGAL
jgi:hypothetical protein